MIECILIENSKSLRHVDLTLGRLNLFIGTNASGKSNFFDALRVIQGIGYGFTIGEVLDGKPKSATSEVWDAIRGGSANALFRDGNDNSSVGEAVRLTLRLAPKQRLGDTQEFMVALSALDGCVREERLTCGKDIYNSNPGSPPLITNRPSSPVWEVRYDQGKRGKQPHLSFEKSRAVLQQLPKRPECSKLHLPTLEGVMEQLSNMQRIDPSPLILRGYSQAHSIQRMGERGENFAALVNSICADSSSKSAFLSWLKELTPTELDEVGTRPGAVGEPMFVLKERDREFPAPVLSDGTLRFAAITAAFFQPDLPDILTIEEIENAVHASRLRLLVELLRSQARQGKVQIMATTHSPIVLSWLEPEEYATTFYCKRDVQTGESKICPLIEIPSFAEIVKKQPISELFAEGWMEAAL
ncbi:MAG: AAA family ATPase [Verrucomicrobia bacterium]|nr:AAA family ATPase [Verrucomicrobiota bacterium]